MLTKLMVISVTANLDTVECAVKLVSIRRIYSCRCLARGGVSVFERWQLFLCVHSHFTQIAAYVPVILVLSHLIESPINEIAPFV